MRPLEEFLALLVFDTMHTIYELCLPSERGCVVVSCGGGFCSSDCAYVSVWDSVLHMTDILLLLFPVPRVRWVYLRCRLVVKVSLLIVRTILHGKAFCR